MKKNRELYTVFSVFFLSLSVLVLEISFTRIFSVILAYNYAFIVLSLALFGLGLGGLYIHYRYQNRIDSTTEQNKLFLATLSTVYALVACFSVLIIGGLPIIPGGIFVYFLLALMPFIVAGAYLSQIFRDWAEIVGTIYFTDLAGAASGALLFLLLISQIGVLNTALIASGFGSIAAFLIIVPLLPKSLLKLLLLGIATCPLAIVLLGLSSGFDLRVPMGRTYGKDLARIMQTPGVDLEILESRWSSFGRTDLTEDKSDEMAMIIFVDGAAGTPMYRFNGDISDEANQAIVHLNKFPGYFPLEFLRDSQKDSALSIGTGGGRDVLLLLMAGINKISAVEVNSDTVAIVRDYADYNGGLYTDNPAVTVHIEEGRNFIRRSQERFDVILLSLPVSKTASSLNSYALNENTLFTTEAILDYFDHLTPEGQLVIVTHHMKEIYKLIFTSVEALHHRGMETQQIMTHIFSGGPPGMLVFTLRKSPFTREESEVLHQRVHAAGLVNETLFIPNIKQAHFRVFDNSKGLESVAMMNRALVGLAEGSFELDQILQNSPIDLFPPTDDRPFFYKMERGLPRLLQFLLALSVVVVAFVLYQPLLELKWKSQNTIPTHDHRLKIVSFKIRCLFSLLGIGYMMIELSMLQRFTVYLGQPAITLSILLFSLLIGSAIGSYSLRFLNQITCKNIIIFTTFTVAVLIVSYLFILPSIFQRTLIPLTLLQRLLIAIGLIILPGFFMGLPFPTAIRLLKENHMENSIPWMWGINGAMSVLGGVLTVIIAITIGYSWAFILGAAAYIVICLLFLLEDR